MRRPSRNELVLLVPLLGLLATTLAWAIYAWTSIDGAMNKHGWIALCLGAFFSLIIGCGLMALMFFSSRSGHDEAADPFRKHPEKK